MAPIHPRSTDDLIAQLANRVQQLQSALARGPVMATYTSAALPSNPPTGLEVLVADYGLRAYWNGSAWVYPPQLITRRVLTGPSSSVRLPASGSIPPVFTDLRVVISAKSDGTGGTTGYDNASLQFNGVTAANYGWQTWYKVLGGASVSVADGTSNTSAQAAAIWNSHFATAGRGLSTIEIPNYASSGNLKGFTAHSCAYDGGTAGVMQLYSGMLGGTNTGPVTDIELLMNTGNFVAGSEFSLYGS